MNKIDLIIEAIRLAEYHVKAKGWGDDVDLELYTEALAAARELKAFREVLIRDNYILRFYPSDTGWMCGISNEMMDAIDEVKYD